MEQRRAVFIESEEKAKKEGNGSKARRLGRQRKQYDDVIKKLKAGMKVDIGHLTVPPNCPPLPGESSNQLSFEETLQKGRLKYEIFQKMEILTKNQRRP